MGEPVKKQNPKICPNCKAYCVPQAKYCVCGHKWIHTAFAELLDEIAILTKNAHKKKV